MFSIGFSLAICFLRIAAHENLYQLRPDLSQLDSILSQLFLFCFSALEISFTRSELLYQGRTLAFLRSQALCD